MKTLIAIAVAGATLASAGAAIAAPGTANPVIKSNVELAASARPQARRNKHLTIRPYCGWPRIHVRWEWVKLHQAGYRKVRYQGTKVFLPRCAKFLYFSACHGIKRYKVIVRFIRSTRYVIALRQGYCFRLHQRRLRRS